VRLLLHHRGGPEPGYEDVARALFAVRGELGPDEPIVLKTVARFLEDERRKAGADC
jgi:hypothetical protein